MDDSQTKFKKLKEFSQKSDRIFAGDAWRFAHDLAEAQYEPAIEFFVNCFDHPSWTWRSESVFLLGHHYAPLTDEIVEKIRQLALLDEYSDVRLAAVGVLGIHTKLPDKALLKVLDTDPNVHVRRSVFRAILRLCGVRSSEISPEGKKIIEAVDQPTTEYLRCVLDHEGIDYNREMFNFS